MNYTMREYKRGLSTVVVSLIMIIIVLGAVTVIWFVVRDIVGSGAEQVSLGTRCLEVDVKSTKLECTGDVCSVTVERGPGGDVLGGVKLVYTNSSGETNYVQDVSGDIAVLEAKTVSSGSTGITNINKVDVAIYFLDSSGNEQLCSVSNTLSN